MPATNITRPTACWEKEYPAVCRRGLAGRECVYIRGNVTSTGGSKTTAQGGEGAYQAEDPIAIESLAANWTRYPKKLHFANHG